MNAFILSSFVSSIVAQWSKELQNWPHNVKVVTNHPNTNLPSTSEYPSNYSANWITGKGTFHRCYFDDCIWTEPWEKETHNCEPYDRATSRCRKEDCCWFDLETAKEECGKSSECAGFYTFFGRYIARGHFIPWGIELNAWTDEDHWVKKNSLNHILKKTKRVRQKFLADYVDVAGYTKKGLGKCRHQYYNSRNQYYNSRNQQWEQDPKDAVSVQACADKCDSERKCRHFSLRLGVFGRCDRFRSRQSDCSRYEYGANEYVDYDNVYVTYSKIIPRRRSAKPTPAPTDFGMTLPPTSERYFMYEHMNLSPCDRNQGIPARCTYVTNVSGKDLCACDKKGVGYCNRTVKEGWCRTDGEDKKKLKKSLKRCAKSCIDHWFDEE